MKTPVSRPARICHERRDVKTIQRAVRPTSGINAGALMPGVMGATGANALQIAGLLA
jgi:hypothetical protein